MTVVIIIIAVILVQTDNDGGMYVALANFLYYVHVILYIIIM